MRRREFIALISSAAGAWPLASRAQQPRVIGILDPGIPDKFDAFRQGMTVLGYVEGQNVSYAVRSAEGRPERIPALTAELVRMNVDVIVTAAPLPVRTVKQATSTIPIVFAALGEATENGIVSNLSRPGGNLTGLSFLNTELSAKRLEVLHDAFPRVRKVAVLADSNSSARYIQVTEAAAPAVGMELQMLRVSNVDGFEAAFEAARAQRAEAMDVLASAFFNANRSRLVELASKYRLPAIYETGEYVHSGGLMSYGPNLFVMFRRAASFVDRILKGAYPGDLPVEQPTKFELVVNLKTARALGLVISEAFLLRADEVIE